MRCSAVVNAVEDVDKKEAKTDKEKKLKPPPPTPTPASAPSPAPPITKPVLKSATISKMDPNLPNAVMKYSPVHTVHTYTAGKHDRVAILFEAPASFDGSEGSYKVGCFDPKVFSFAIPIQEVFTDPDILHAWLQIRHKRSFGEDSEKTKNWKRVTKDFNEKDAVFSVALPFGCEEEVASDLTHDGFLFFEPEVGGKKTPLCYVELKSLHKVEQIKKTAKAIKKESFTSPGKTSTTAKGVSGDMASKAMLMEMMMEALKDMPKSESNRKKRTVASPGEEEFVDAMEIDDDAKINFHKLFESMMNKSKKTKGTGKAKTNSSGLEEDEFEDETTTATIDA